MYGESEPYEVSYAISRNDINNKQKLDKLMDSTDISNGNFYIAAVLDKSCRNILE